MKKRLGRQVMAIVLSAALLTVPVYADTETDETAAEVQNEEMDIVTEEENGGEESDEEKKDETEAEKERKEESDKEEADEADKEESDEEEPDEEETDTEEPNEEETDKETPDETEAGKEGNEETEKEEPEEEQVHTSAAIGFAESGMDYIFGGNGGVVSCQSANVEITQGKEQIDEEKAVITYSIDDPVEGITIDPDTGEVRIDDFRRLSEVLEQTQGERTVQVRAVYRNEIQQAEEGETEENAPETLETEGIYTIRIHFAEISEQILIPEGIEGEQGWYRSAVVLSCSEESFEVSKVCEPDLFSEKTEFKEGEQIAVYIRNRQTGEISQRITMEGIQIDTTLPEAEVSFEEPEKEADGVKYYTGETQIRLKVTEKNFDPEKAVVTIKKDGAEPEKAEVSWADEEEVHTAVLKLSEQGTYVIRITAEDRAGNEMKEYVSSEIMIGTEDTKEEESGKETKPAEEEPAEEKTDEEKQIEDKPADHKSDETEEKSEKNSPEEEKPAEKENKPTEKKEKPVEKEEKPDKTQEKQIEEKSDRTEEKQTEKQTEEKKQDEKMSDEEEESILPVKDRTAPELNCSIGTASAVKDGIGYFDRDIVVTLTVKEENFVSEAFDLQVIKDNKSMKIQPSWKQVSEGYYQGTITLREDGTYQIRAEYTDPSGNQMTPYQSGVMVLDTGIQAPVIQINGRNANGISVKNQAAVSFVFRDENADSVRVSLKRIGQNGISEDVTDLLNAVYREQENGILFSASLPDGGRITDGIYTLEVNCTDKAGNRTKNSAAFVINRHGSTYAYDTFFTELKKRGSTVVKEVSGDLIITEINPDSLVETGVMIEYNGRIMKDPKVIIRQENSTADVVQKGWNRTQYIISRENFTGSGVYKISVYSVDEAGNRSGTDNAMLVFTVDNTSPELFMISTGNTNRSGQTELELSAFDSLGLSNITVYADGEEVKQTGVPNENIVDQKIYVDKDSKTIRISAVDQAGNEVEIEQKLEQEPGTVFNGTKNGNEEEEKSGNMQRDPLPAILIIPAAGAALFIVVYKKKRRSEHR